MNKKVIFSLFAFILLIGLMGIVLSEGETATKIIETDTTENIGNLIGTGLDATDITAKGIELTKKDDISTLTFLDSGSVKIGENLYESVQKGSIIKINSAGLITFANLTATKDTLFNFDGKTYKVLAGKNIIYEKAGENSIFTGNFQVGDDKINGITKDGFGKVTFSKDGKISEIWKGTDVTTGGVDFKVTENNLNLYYDENFRTVDHNGENYFNFGNGKVSVGGTGFSFDLGKTNSVFGNMNITKIVKGIGTKTRNLGFTLNGGNLEISSKNTYLGFDINGVGDYVIDDGRAVIYSQKGYVKDSQGKYVLSDKNSVFVKTDYGESSSYGLSYSYDINLNQGEYALEDNILKDSKGNVLVNLNSAPENVVYTKQNSVMTKEEIANIEKQTGKGTFAADWSFSLKDEQFDKELFEAANIANLNKDGIKISPVEFATFAAGEGWFFRANSDSKSFWDKWEQDPNRDYLPGEVGLTGIMGYFSELQKGDFVPKDSSLVYYDSAGTTRAKIRGEDVSTFFAGTVAYFKSIVKNTIGESEYNVMDDDEKLFWTTYCFNSGKGNCIKKLQDKKSETYQPVNVDIKNYDNTNAQINSKIREAIYLSFKKYFEYL